MNFTNLFKNIKIKIGSWLLRILLWCGFTNLMKVCEPNDCHSHLEVYVDIIKGSGLDICIPDKRGKKVETYLSKNMFKMHLVLSFLL